VGDAGDTGAMVDPTGNEYPTPGMDPDEPIPDDPAELDDPGSLPPPPIESTPDDPGGDPEAEPSPT
jgi:hypothetical protein